MKRSLLLMAFITIFYALTKGTPRGSRGLQRHGKSVATRENLESEEDASVDKAAHVPLNKSRQGLIFGPFRRARFWVLSVRVEAILVGYPTHLAQNGAQAEQA